MKEVVILPDDVSWSGEDRVVIRSIGLLQNLVDDGKASVLAEMKDLIDIPAESVSIDQHGDIIIKNKAVKQAIENAFTDAPGGLAEPTNYVLCGNPNAAYVCGVNAGCGKVVETEEA